MALSLVILQFTKTFLLAYFFEEIQQLKFTVYDVDDRKHVNDVQRHDLIGEMECTLADIVTAGQEYKRNLREKGNLNSVSWQTRLEVLCVLTGTPYCLFDWLPPILQEPPEAASPSLLRKCRIQSSQYTCNWRLQS